MEVELTQKPPRPKRKEASTTGGKIYVSSKVVDALNFMKKHTEDLIVKRGSLKERAAFLSQSTVIDEPRPTINSNLPRCREPEEDVLDNEYESDYQSHYQTEDEDDEHVPDDITAKTGVSKLGMFFNQRIHKYQ